MTKKVTIPDILGMKREGRKIPVLTAYGCAMARILDKAGVPVLLVGDSVGMVEAGYESTLPVTLEEMVYHTRSVKRGAERALVIADMPFMSYQVSTESAIRNAGTLIKQGGAEAVKIEGGERSAEVIEAIASIDIPVMGHIGLTPQSVHVMGGYKVQGKDEDSAKRLISDARAVEQAGAFAVVVEAVPAPLASTITKELSIPTIGIGAGVGCGGQVLVVNDMLGLDALESDEGAPRFVKRYAELGKAVAEAAKSYIEDVEESRFPGKEHCY